jgi:hypothetical protein|tara:strand:- start:8680 stop:8901 length:222 start_codon:yes stop_codon:yes gene_type:complete
MNTFIKKLIVCSFLKYQNFLKINFNDSGYWPWGNSFIIITLKQRKPLNQPIKKHTVNIKKKTLLFNKIYDNAI